MVGPQVVVYLMGILLLPLLGMWSASSRMQIPLMQHPAAWLIGAMDAVDQHSTDCYNSPFPEDELGC